MHFRGTSFLLILFFLQSLACSEAEFTEKDKDSGETLKTETIVNGSQSTDATAETGGDVKTLLEELIDNERQTRIQEVERLDKRIDDLDAKIDRIYVELKGDIKKLDERLLVLKADLDTFKNEVAQTYATKEALEALAKRVDVLEFEIIPVLKGDIAANTTLITEKTEALRVELIKDLADLEIDMIGRIQDAEKRVTDKLLAHINTYQEFVIEQGKLITDLTLKVNQAIAVGEVNSEIIQNQLLPAINDYMIFKNEIQTQISIKYSELKEKIDTNTQDIKGLDDKLNKTIAAQNDMEKNIQDQIDELSITIEHVRVIALNAEALARANQITIDAIEGDLTVFKTQVYDKFAATDVEIQLINGHITNLYENDRVLLQKIHDQAKAFAAAIGELAQNQFVSLTLNLTQIQNVSVSLTQEIEVNILDLHPEVDVSAANPLIDEIIKQMAALVEDQWEVKNEFILMVNPDPNKPEQDLGFTNSVGAACNMTASADFPNGMEMDWFELLSQVYIQEFSLGLRHGNTDIFFGYPLPVEQQEKFANMLIASIVGFNNQNVSETCIAAVKIWAKKVLFEDGIFKQKLIVHDGLHRAVDIMNTTLARLVDAANKLSELLNISEATDLDLLAALIIQFDHSAHYYNLVQIAINNFNTFINNQIILAGLNPELVEYLKKTAEELKASIAQLEASNADILAEITAINERQKKILIILKTMAQRSGWDDLVEEVQLIGDELNFEVPIIEDFSPQITEVYHYFGKDGVSQDLNRPCRWTQPMNGGDLSEYRHHFWGSKCHVNFRRGSINDKLGKADHLVLLAAGSAHAIKVEDSWSFSQLWDLRTGVEAVPGSINGGTVWGSHANAWFEMPVGSGPLAHHIQNKGNGVAKVFLTPGKAVGSEITEWGQPYEYRLRLYSPIVLDMVNIGTPNTVHQTASKTRFDLDADGHLDRVGWIEGKQGGFLAIDLNQNGHVDDGSELFGEASLLPNGTRAKNGYAALAQYDTNKDKHIDAKDKVFGKLFVWFDNNQDGISQKDEMQSLAEAKVTKISLKYKELHVDKQLNNGNLIKYQANFWGPEKCGETGCNSYDIFFGHSTKVVAETGSAK
ncbi:MAG: hypothetical protein AB8G05_09595 [Oligoflexales bacterium]